MQQEGPDQFGAHGEHLGHQILEIDHLDVVFPQQRGKGVMLPLRHLQKRDIVKEQLAEPFGRQLQQLASRAVQQDLFQRLDLVSDTDSFHIPLLPCFLFRGKTKGTANTVPFDSRKSPPGLCAAFLCR